MYCSHNEQNCTVAKILLATYRVLLQDNPNIYRINIEINVLYNAWLFEFLSLASFHFQLCTGSLLFDLFFAKEIVRIHFRQRISISKRCLVVSLSKS